MGTLARAARASLQSLDTRGLSLISLGLRTLRKCMLGVKRGAQTLFAANPLRHPCHRIAIPYAPMVRPVTHPRVPGTMNPAASFVNSQTRTRANVRDGSESVLRRGPPDVRIAALNGPLHVLHRKPYE